MKISIIIPIYNVVEYIPRCLDSIYSQNVDEDIFEVIAINDGSPDNASEIVQSYMSLHSNLQLIEKENGGVSSARNVGISKALGDYLLFVDPDDELIQGSLLKIAALIDTNLQADVIFARSFSVGGENYQWNRLFKEGEFYMAMEILNKGYLRGSICGGFYNRKFVNDNKIRFIEGIRNGEDTNFSLQMHFYTNKIQFADIPLYQVVGREGSASLVFNKERIDKQIEGVKIISDYAKNLRKQNGNKPVLNYMLYSPISNLVGDSIKTFGIDLKYLKKRDVHEYCKFDIHKDVKFLRRKMYILNISFHLYYSLCKFINELSRR